MAYRTVIVALIFVLLLFWTQSKGDSQDTLILSEDYTLINFWASWCYACEKEVPLLARFSNLTGIPIIAINVGEPSAIIEQTRLGWKMPFAILRDGDGELRDKYGVAGVPETLLLDQSGDILWRKRGVLAKEDIEEMMELLRKSSII